MGFAFRMMVWVIAFNLAVGITIVAFGQTNWLLTPGYTQGGGNTGLSADTGINQANQLNTEVGTGGTVPVEESTFWYKFLDFISLGFYNRIRNFLSTTIFSIPTLFNTMGILPAPLLPYINGGITLIFVMGMFELFTGKDLTLR
jgi:hypothetical protein